MKKYVAILILFFSLNINIFALPGMSSVTYDFSLNKDIFSSVAINCQSTIPAGIGLEQIAEFMNKMNCNNIVDPEKFCNCVRAISTKDLAESVNSNTAKEVIEQLAIESVTGKVKDIDLYQDLVAIIGSNQSIKQCFESSPSDHLFGEFLKRRNSGAKITMTDRMLSRVFTDISADILGAKKIDKIELFKEANDIKKFTKDNSSFSIVNKNSDSFKKIISKYSNDTPLKKLIENDEFISFIFQDMNELLSTVRKSNADGIDPDGQRIVNSAIEVACEQVSKDIEFLIEGADIPKTIRDLTVSYQSPVTAEQIKASEIIQDRVNKRLKKQNTKSSSQEINFMGDVLFCKDLEESNRVITKSSNDEGFDDSLKEKLVISTQEMVHNKEAKEKARSKLRDSQSEYRKTVRSNQKKKREVDFLNGLLNGDYSIDSNDSSITLDSKSLELLGDAQRSSQKIYRKISSGNSNSEGLVISKKEIKDLVELREREISSLQAKEDTLAESRDIAQLEYDKLSEKLDIAEEKNETLMFKYGEKVGMQKTLSLVSEVEGSEGDKLGIESSLSIVFKNEIRNGNPILTEDSDFIFSTNKNIEKLDHKENIAKNNSLTTLNEVVETNDPQSIIQEELVKDSINISPDKKDSNFFSDNVQTSTIQNRNIANVTETSKPIQNENILEDRIKELESSIRSKALEQEDKSIQNSSEKNVSGLNSLSAEREAIQNELNEINKQVSTNNKIVSNPVAEVKKYNNSSLSNKLSNNEKLTQRDRSVASESRSLTNTASNGGSQQQLQSLAEDNTVTEPSSSEGPSVSYKENIKLDSLSDSDGREESSNIKFEAIGTDSLETDTRVVMVDFLMSEENLLEQEDFIKTLFTDNESQIIIETVEGKKIVVKQGTISIDKIESDKKNLNQKRHKNLIKLMQISKKDVN